jgi:uncharacterized protein YejL (UPF0352 family)
MKKQNRYMDESFEAMLADVDGMDNAAVESELMALGVDPGVAGSVVRNAIQRAVAKNQPARRGDRVGSLLASMMGLFRDSPEPVYGGKRAPRKRKSDAE